MFGKGGQRGRSGHNDYTGKSRTLVRRDLVSEESIRRNETIEKYICAHGDEKTYPTAEVKVDVES